MTDAEELMDFLASPEAMELPDQIEEVNAKQLDKLVQEKMFVAVFFCKFFVWFMSFGQSVKGRNWC